MPEAKDGAEEKGKGGTAAAGASGLFAVQWRRVVLDEAHTIKNRATVAHRACCLLDAPRRWAVTGTPMQNSIEDVASLLKFLRHQPWDERLWWEKVIGRPYERGDADALPRLKAVLQPIMLRRRKESLTAPRALSAVEARGGAASADGSAADVCADGEEGAISRAEGGGASKEGSGPRKEVVRREEAAFAARRTRVRAVDFTSAERTFYNGLFTQSKTEFEGFAAAGSIMANFAAILVLLLRLRQACDHPFLVLGGPRRERAARTKQQQRRGSAQSAKEAKAARFVSRLYRKCMEASHSTGGSAASASMAAAAGAAAASTSTSDVGVSPESSAAAAAASGSGGAHEQAATGKTNAHLRSFLEGISGDPMAALAKLECPVCFDAPPEDPILTPCGHCFCRACVATMAQCPVCRAPLGDHSTTLVAITVPSEVVPSLEVLEKSGKWRTSSKLAAVLDELQRGIFGAAAQAPGAGGKARAERDFFRSAAVPRVAPEEGRSSSSSSSSSSESERESASARSAPRPPAAAHAKAVVFSQFAFMLDMVELTLRGASPPIRCVRLDGNMSQRQREIAIRRFKTDVDIKVFVVSLKAGGLGT